jgi:hypothetical protein
MKTWEIYNTGGLTGDRYQIGRIKNPAEPLHGGNVEWHGGLYLVREDAEKALLALTANERQDTCPATGKGGNAV